MKCYHSGEDFRPGDKLIVVTDYLGERVIIKEKYYEEYMGGEKVDAPRVFRMPSKW